LIPEEFRAQLLSKALELSNFMNRCTLIPMATNSIGIPYVDDADRSSGYLHGAVKLYWTDEEGSKTSSKPKFGKVTLVLKKLIGLAYSSDEILQDSPISLEPLLNKMFTEAFAWTMDDILINGTGAGQPLGLINAPALVTVSKESGQAADTIVFENIVKMYARMPSANRKNAVWLANDDTFSQLATMSLAVGTGGVPVYLPANQAAGQPFDTLLGKPLIFTEHCQKLGDKGDIFFVDWSEYLLGQKRGQGIQTATSIHLKFDYDQTAFRFVFRVDGQPWWKAALTPRYSSDTLSPYVTLAARA